MTYMDGFITAVPTANKETYLAWAKSESDMFKKLGALRLVETWGDDIPEGKTNSLHTAVLRREDETVVFSWVLWPSKEVRDKAWQTLMQDPDADEKAKAMPFDGSRMIYGGFEVISDSDQAAD